MKIICPGLPKTGTTSMAIALRQLGYNNVHDHEEHLLYHFNVYCDLYDGRVKESDVLPLIYRDVDAVLDTPANFFWMGLLRAFPNAKVILTVRDNEHVWYGSWTQHVKYFIKTHTFSPLRWYSVILPVITSTGTKVQNLFRCIGNSVCGQDILKLRDVNPKSGLTGFSEDLQKDHYLKYNAAVKALVPTGQLLVFNVKEGWDPLCRFLGLPVPDFPFPYENKATDDGRIEIVDKSNLFDVMKVARNEIVVSVTVYVALTAICGLCLFRFME